MSPHVAGCSSPNAKQNARLKSIVARPPLYAFPSTLIVGLPLAPTALAFLILSE